MVDLMGTLGLENVEDPDNLPDNTYKGLIKDAGYMKSKAGNLGIFVIYKVNDPQSKHHGREKFDWTGIGEGNVHKKEDGDWHFDRSIMSEKQKPYFMKRMGQLGVPESKLNDLKDEDLKSRVGLNVFFKIQNKDGFNNVTYVELIDGAPVDAGSISSSGVNPFEDTPPTTTSATGSNNLVADI